MKDVLTMQDLFLTIFIVIAGSMFLRLLYYLYNEPNWDYHDKDAVRKFDRKKSIWTWGYLIILILCLIIGLIVNQ